MKQIDLTYIVDDDNIFVFVLNKNLEKNDLFLNFISFKNGEAVLEDLKQKNSTLPNLILLDLNMPFFDGWQFLEAIEELNIKNKLNIFIMTSSIDQKDIEKAKKYSTVKDFISKPINQEKLNLIASKIQ